LLNHNLRLQNKNFLFIRFYLFTYTCIPLVLHDRAVSHNEYCTTNTLTTHILWQ